jgi:hypothetical protein
MLHHKLGQPLRQSKIDQACVALLLHAFNRGNPVHVALDEVSPEAIADSERALEVEAASDRPIGNGCTPKCRHHGGDGKPSWSMVQHRETGAVHRDALAVGEVGIPRRNAELSTGIGLRDVGDLANVVD